MGYKRIPHQVQIDAATIALVRLMVQQIKNLETSKLETDGNRRFVGRIVDATSEAVREQLNKEGTWS
jgi:hypothetical protein